MTPALLTVPEVATICRVSTDTVRRWITKRRIPAVRIGGRVLVRRADLEAITGGLDAQGAA